MKIIIINDGQLKYSVNRGTAHQWLEQHDISIEPYQGTKRLVMDSETYTDFCSEVPCVHEPGTVNKKAEEDAPESWTLNEALAGMDGFEVLTV